MSRSSSFCPLLSPILYETASTSSLNSARDHRFTSCRHAHSRSPHDCVWYRSPAGVIATSPCASRFCPPHAQFYPVLPSSSLGLPTLHLVYSPHGAHGITTPPLAGPWPLPPRPASARESRRDRSLMRELAPGHHTQPKPGRKPTTRHTQLLRRGVDGRHDGIPPSPHQTS
jgi:hypothetical protein